MSKHQLKELTQRLTALAEKLKWHNVNHAQDVALSSESITSLIERLEVADKDGREYAILAGTNAARAEKAERERDEYAEAERSKAVKNVTLQDEIYGLKAELARRDAAAGEAVGKFVKCGDTWYETDATDGIPLYTAAQPVVVPPEISEAIARLEKGYFRRWVRAYKNPEEPEGYVGGSVLVSDLVKLFEFAKSAQQQKVVELPEPVKWPEIPFKYFSEEQVFSMLDAAGVKWEVKK